MATMLRSRIVMLRTINNGILDIRMGSVYKNMLRCNYPRAMLVLKNTINVMESTNVANNVDNNIKRVVLNKMYCAMIHLATKRYGTVHELVRDIHYILVAKDDNDDNGDDEF